MPLEELSLRGTPVSDITALRGLPLRSLLMCNCKNLIDLSPLSDCQTLQSITLPPRAQDIECLRDLSQLERISFREVSRPPFGPDMTAEEFWREYDANRNRP